MIDEGVGARDSAQELEHGSLSEIEISEIADCTCARLRRATRRITQLYDQALRPTGLTVGQFGLLAQLYGMKVKRGTGLTVSALAERLALESSTLTRTLAPLKARGLVADHPDPDDGRARLVSITDKGCQTLAAAVPHWRNAQQEVKQKLGAGASKELRRLLDAAFDAVAV